MAILKTSKRIYFVRHGESEGNAHKLYGNHTQELTPRGHAQVVSVAKRCAAFPIGLVVTSSLARAQETATIIAQHVGAPIETTDLFAEIQQPSVFEGKSYFNPRLALLLYKQIKQFGSEWKHSDEEIFADLKKRAHEAMDFLESRRETHILVVTHDMFLRVLIARIILGESLAPKECLAFMRTLRMANTGVSILDYSPTSPLSHWCLSGWNDLSHLGQL